MKLGRGHLIALAALVGVALLLVYLLRPASGPATTSRAAPGSSPVAARDPAPARTRPALEPPATPAPPTVEEAEIPPGTPTHRNALGTGDGTGIYAFPLAGTKPLRRGLIVPEGFVLPEGYVRHYQTSDDGHTMPAILMFHPDYRPTNRDGKPIALPADLIVPPELAPPGMPLDALDPGPVHADLDENNRPQ